MMVSHDNTRSSESGLEQKELEWRKGSAGAGWMDRRMEQRESGRC